MFAGCWLWFHSYNNIPVFLAYYFCTGVQTFDSHHIMDEKDVCNVTTVTRKKDYRFDVNASLKDLHSVIPVASEFDSEYSNPCWHSRLNLEPHVDHKGVEGRQGVHVE